MGSLSSLRYTENTIRNLLLKELEKRGVKAAPEVSYRTPVGVMKPDALLQNGGNYIVETKLGAEARLLDAITSLYDYTKYIDAVGGFAILLPEELRRPVPIDWLQRMAMAPVYKYTVTGLFKDDRKCQHFSGSLTETADWISDHVLKPPTYAEPDVSLTIGVLGDAVDALNVDLAQLREEELEDVFGGRSVFENILQYEEGEYPIGDMRRAATYLLINQMLFYQILTNILAYPIIDEERFDKPSDLTRYFNRVLQYDYASIFGFDIASRLPPGSVPTLRKVVRAIKALAPEKIRRDVLGQVFHDLIPFETRKSVAAFYTNNMAAEILAQLSIDKPDAEVMDLAVGSGTLLVAAYRRKRKLHESLDKPFRLEDHFRFLEEELTGIDVMPFAAHLAVIHLSLQALPFEARKVRVAVWDSTELKPDRVIPAISRELRAAYRRPTLDIFFGKPSPSRKAFIEKGVVTMEGIGGEEIPLRKVDVVIMNPPFTRQERLPKDYKDRLSRRLKEYENQLHGQLGLWGYFLLLADRFVKQGGRMALVYPARPLSAKSAEGIRKLLLDNYIIEYIITTWERAAFSESAQYREVLLVARKLDGDKWDRETLCKVINLRSLPRSLEEAHSLADEIRGITSDHDSERIKATILTRKELEATIDNWFFHIASFDLGIAKRWANIRSQATGKLVSFREYLDRRGMDVIRGVETKSGFGFQFYETFIMKYPERALKSYDRWIADKIVGGKVVAKNKITGETIEIPAEKVCSGIRRASGIEILDLSNSQDYVIVEVFEGIDKILSANSMQNFIKHSNAWRNYVESRFGRFMISRRFNLSAVGTNLLAFYSDYPTTGQNLWSLKDISEDEAKILTLWFNSTPNLLQVYLQRIETEGAWMEINRGMILDFLLLDPDSLSEDEREVFLQLFEEIKNIEFPSIMEQLEQKHPIRRRIDGAILELLGFDEGEIESILDHLYPALHNEIVYLKELMAG